MLRRVGAGDRAPIAGRYFLVGCERSGTTLLQAMLARHSRVFSFPESHFFCRVVPQHRLYRALGLANWRKCRLVLGQLTDAVGRQDLERLIPGHSPFLRSQTRAFRHILDASTLGQGKDIWVEKTPHHLYQIPAIRRHIPNARFIHIVRDGRDVSASIQDASHGDPGYWGTWSLDDLAQTWNRAVRDSISYQGQEEHLLVFYEALLEDAPGELARVSAFLGVDFEPGMLDHQAAAASVTGWMADRPWMESVHQPLRDTRLQKYTRVFSPAQQDRLSDLLQWGGAAREALDGDRPLGVHQPALPSGI